MDEGEVGRGMKKGRDGRARKEKGKGKSGVSSPFPPPLDERSGEVTVRPCLNVVASVGALPSVVEPTLSRALCPVLVGISGAPTGPISRVSG